MDVRSGARGLGKRLLASTVFAALACAGSPPWIPWIGSGAAPADPSGLACPRTYHVETESGDFGRVVVCEAEDGRRIGYEIRFDTDGSLHTINVIDDDGSPRTYISWRRPGGGIVRYEPRDEAGRGVWTEWTHDGKLLSEIESLNGAMDGQAVWYYEDGKKRMRGRHEDDGMTGLWERWYPSGRIHSACEWSEGLQHGRCQMWDARGTLRIDGEYEHGAKSGKWLFWDSYGNPVRPPADAQPEP